LNAVLQARRPIRERKLVLVVENDDDTRTIYAATLEHAGYEVVCARTVKEGAAAAALRLPSAVVLDCHLPDGSGLDLLRTWRASPPMNKVPVVVVTAYSDPDHVPMATDATAFVPRMLPATTPIRRASGSK
jgi:DNA-binding response OmpR family regulator